VNFLFDIIFNIFSLYELKARIFPSLLTLAPFTLSILIWYPDLINFESSLFTSLVIIIILFLIAKVARERGKVIQGNLLEEWGGFPSSIYLKHSDATIDERTKKRYHNYLSKNISHINLPTDKEELENPDLYKKEYNSAIQWLLEKTRDTNKYHLLYQDNINYGFSRNMLGIKPFGIIFTLISIVINCFCIYQNKYSSLFELPPKAWLSFIISMFFILLWIVFVRKNWVKSTAAAYARTLLATCEDIA
jgi:hypothetical protein